MKSGAVAGIRSRWWWRLAVIIAVIAVALVVFRQRTDPPKVEAPGPAERSLNELVHRDGLLLDHGLPFSGIAFDTYGGGEMKSRSMVSNGLLQGLSEGWDTNGVLQVTEFFVSNVSHGVRTKFHSNGKTLSVANIVNGQIEGLYQRWHENGILAEKVYLTNGIPHGESIGFHPDGSVKARVRLEHGTVVEQQFWEPGEMR
jgi:antitoxin component YwqK of YwqJK toxin-antitoxin module